MSEVTRILSAIEQGDPHAAGQLLPLVYDELRTLAAQRLAREKPGQTLQATALVHEAYLRLVASGGRQPPGDKYRGTDAPRSPVPVFASRGHFFAAAAEAMRRILVENARRKGRLKRGGQRQRVDLDDVAAPSTAAPDALLAVDDALTALAAEDPTAAELIKLRYFAGFSVEEAGQMLGLSRSTAYEHWAYGRAWLRCKLLGGADPNAG
jgi:RNA polymerase sigma factor (sigma-70 family)